ncbi:uncharacterized protein P174DRAFT_44691 [Aspergillus novofumigatus IBT 16806]|uniref:Uncharacterized protein n=1 Tax=Aspergillus novofumigatus (strain IBT 16806) TaxID=1392255 RepID=A0A2I1CNS5_ASPN1|nr:uncharacterized protein P174DRAFT_44691 [Aspergillus novofumigatus IBT 16806]PKX99297.1 hypothetical protein P174DRAFT_44691 [Aspergillus novofumigatus IBT 16806]
MIGLPLAQPFPSVSFIIEHFILAHIQSRYTGALYDSKLTNHFALVLVFFFFLSFSFFPLAPNKSLVYPYQPAILRRILVSSELYSLANLYSYYYSSFVVCHSGHYHGAQRQNPPAVACPRLRINPGRTDISGSLEVVLGPPLCCSSSRWQSSRSPSSQSPRIIPDHPRPSPVTATKRDQIIALFLRP